MDVSTITETQQKDKVLSLVYELISKNSAPPNGGKWDQFPLRRYKQIWSQLVLYQSILCHKTLSPSLKKAKHLIVVPQALQNSFSHYVMMIQGIKELTPHCLIYQTLPTGWASAGVYTVRYCKFYVKCQKAKSL